MQPNDSLDGVVDAAIDEEGEISEKGKENQKVLGKAQVEYDKIIPKVLSYSRKNK